MSVMLNTRPKSTATSRMGSTSGRVMTKRCRKNPAPSTSAASWMSWGIDDSPPSEMTVASGIVRHTCTPMIDAIASFGWPSQMGQVSGPKMPTWRRVQLMTL